MDLIHNIYAFFREKIIFFVLFRYIDIHYFSVSYMTIKSDVTTKTTKSTAIICPTTAMRGNKPIVRQKRTQREECVHETIWLLPNKHGKAEYRKANQEHQVSVSRSTYSRRGLHRDSLSGTQAD